MLKMQNHDNHEPQRGKSLAPPLFSLLARPPTPATFYISLRVYK